MGQAHPRGGVELEVLPSSGPDPTIFRQHPRYPNVQVVSPPQTAHAPGSKAIDVLGLTAPPPPPPHDIPGTTSTKARPRPIPRLAGESHPYTVYPLESQGQSQSSTSSTAAQRAFGGLSLPRSKSNALVRKLSRRSRSPPPGQPLQTKKSMGPDPFEARPFSPVQSAFGDALEVLDSATATATATLDADRPKTAKAGTFPRVPGPATLNLDKAKAGTLPFPVTESERAATAMVTTSGRTAITPTTPVSRVLPRYSSFSSAQSHKQSIKSSPSRRAEREWRAKVAGLASQNNRSPRATGLGGSIGARGPRGPVPPRRLAAVTSTRVEGLPIVEGPRRSSSPEDDTIATPTTPSPLRSTPITSDGEKGTPAKSFTSNRSFETLGHYASPHDLTLPSAPTTTGGRQGMTLRVASPGTRHCSVPRSVVSSYYFDNRTSRVSTHLSPSVLPSSTLHPVSSIASATPSVILENSDSGEQNKLSEGMETGRCASPAPSRKGDLPPFSSFHLSPASVGPPLSPVPIDQTIVATSNNKPSLPAVPGARRSSANVSPEQPRQLTTPPRLAPLAIATSQSSSSSGPQTPFPISLDRDPSYQTQTPPITPIRHLSVPHTPYSPTTAYILEAEPAHLLHLASAGGFDSNSPRAKHPYARGPSMLIDSPSRHQGTARRSAPLCPKHEVAAAPCRHHQPGTRIKADIIGTRERSHGGSSSTLLSKRRIDLTPGMDSGVRPPKSGLPVADLERWLATTTISE